MDKTLKTIGTVGIGACLMYFLDPDRGRRRRALVRDKMYHLVNLTGDAIGKTANDLSNRSFGLAAETTSFFSAGPVTDQVLIGRVRSKIGRVISHPGAIFVTVNNGRITLSGPVLAHEVDNLLSAVSSVRGVKSVENRLEVHDTAGDISALQGNPPQPEHQFELLQANWSPSARMLVGIGGTALVSYGIRRKGFLGLAFSIGGGLLVARALANMPMDRLFGIGAGRRAVDIHKDINVNAPVEEVFDFWKNVENFPRVMSHVASAKDLGNGRSRWTMLGPGGVPIEWEAEITKIIPNRVIAWKSIGGALVKNAGIIHFQPNPQGGTTIDIQISYNPPGGAIGNVIAYALGVDPKHALDDDMVRFKSLIERGKTTAHGETVTLGELGIEQVPGTEMHGEQMGGSSEAA